MNKKNVYMKSTSYIHAIQALEGGRNKSQLLPDLIARPIMIQQLNYSGKKSRFRALFVHKKKLVKRGKKIKIRLIGSRAHTRALANWGA